MTSWASFSSLNFSSTGFFLFGRRMEVRVMLAKQVFLRPFDFVVGRVPFDTEGFVIIAFFSHGRGYPF